MYRKIYRAADLILIVQFETVAKQFKVLLLRAALLAINEEPLCEGLKSMVRPVSVVKPSSVSRMLHVSLPLRLDTSVLYVVGNIKSR